MYFPLQWSVHQGEGALRACMRFSMEPLVLSPHFKQLPNLESDFQKVQIMCNKEKKKKRKKNKKEIVTFILLHNIDSNIVFFMVLEFWCNIFLCLICTLPTSCVKLWSHSILWSVQTPYLHLKMKKKNQQKPKNKTPKLVMVNFLSLYFLAFIFIHPKNVKLLFTSTDIL